MDGRTAGQTDGWMDGRAGRRMDGQIQPLVAMRRTYLKMVTGRDKKGAFCLGQFLPCRDKINV